MLSKANRYTIIIMDVHTAHGYTRNHTDKTKEIRYTCRHRLAHAVRARVFHSLTFLLRAARTRACIFICLRLFNLFLSDMQISADAFQMETGKRKRIFHDLFSFSWCK